MCTRVCKQLFFLLVLLNLLRCYLSVTFSESLNYIDNFCTDEFCSEVPAIFHLLKRYSKEKQDTLIYHYHNILLHSKSTLNNFKTSLVYDMKISTNLPSPLLIAVVENDLAAVKVMISKAPFGLGFNPNTLDEYGMNGLHLASWLDLSEMAVLLLKHGIDPFRVTIEGFTALHIASMRGFDVTINAILTYFSENSQHNLTCKLLNMKTKDNFYSLKKLTAYDIARLPPMKRFVSRSLIRFLQLCGCASSNKCPVSSKVCSSNEKNDIIDVVQADELELDVTKFAKLYYTLQRPVLIRGNLTSHMGVWSHMHSEVAFLKRYGNIKIKTGEIPYPDAYGRGTYRLETIQDFVISNFQNTFFKDSSIEHCTIGRWMNERVRIAFDGSFFSSYPDVRRKDFLSPALFAEICGNTIRDIY